MVCNTNVQLYTKMALKLERIKVQQNICRLSLCSVSFTSIQLCFAQLHASKMQVELDIVWNIRSYRSYLLIFISLKVSVQPQTLISAITHDDWEKHCVTVLIVWQKYKTYTVTLIKFIK